MRLLDKRGLPPTQAEDVCQDVAVRVLASGVTFETAEDLYRWAAHVARNLHVDLLRATSRVHCDDEVLHGMQADTDVEHEVERRIALSKVLRHWLSLRPADRDALLEGMYTEVEGDRSDAVRRAVRRHRARQRLRVLAKGAFGWAVLGRALRGLRRSPATVQAAAVAVAAPVALLALAPVHPGAAGGDAGLAPTREVRVVSLSSGPRAVDLRDAARPVRRAVPAALAAAPAASGTQTAPGAPTRTKETVGSPGSSGGSPRVSAGIAKRPAGPRPLLCARPVVQGSHVCAEYPAASDAEVSVPIR